MRPLQELRIRPAFADVSKGCQFTNYEEAEEGQPALLEGSNVFPISHRPSKIRLASFGKLAVADE